MAGVTYEVLLGKLIANILSLEYLIRWYLYNAGDGHHEPFPYGKALDDYDVGDKVPHNAVSCFDSLRMLIDRYNMKVESRHQVSRSVVELRDAFAHGRIAARGLTDNYRLVKASKPDKEGNVRITYSQELSREWMEQQVRYTAEEVQKVASHPIFQAQMGQYPIE